MECGLTTALSFMKFCLASCFEMLDVLFGELSDFSSAARVRRRGLERYKLRWGTPGRVFPSTVILQSVLELIVDDGPLDT